MTPDPLAEMNPHLSPYNYCSNSPLNRIDPFGLDDYYYDSEGNLREDETVKKSWFHNLLFGDNYYIQGSDKAPHAHNDNNYWEMESAIREDLQGTLEGVVEDFELQLDAFIKKNAADGSFPFNVGEVLQNSPEGRAWDLKNMKGFEANKIYILGGKGYFNDYVGNVAWSTIMRNSGWPLLANLVGAGINQTWMQKNPSSGKKAWMLLSHPYTFGDYERDSKAIVHGHFRNYFKRRK